MKLTLRKITPIGVRCFSIYRMPDKSIQTVEITEKEYAALKPKDAGEPPRRPHPEAVWLFSGGGSILFDTPSGLQEVGDVWEKIPGFYHIRYGAKPRQVIFLKKDETIGISPNITITSKEGFSIVNGVLEIL